VNPLVRLVRYLGDRLNGELDAREDPLRALEAAYAKEVQTSREAQRGVAEVLTGQKRLELEAESLRLSAERYASAAATGDERARERAGFVTMQRERLLEAIDDLRAQRVLLEATAEKIRQRAELFRTEKLALSARYAAAKASVRAGEHVTGLSDEAAAAADAVERARDAARDVLARAAALAELSAPAEFPVPVTPNSNASHLPKPQ
jgi:phage shock protein A